MSAAATAAGYLYASGRLRGKNKEDNGERKDASRQQPQPQPEKRELRVAVIHKEEGAAPRRQPKIEYRTRRWKPGE